MDPMHVRRDDEEPKTAVYPFRQEKIAVLKFSRSRQQSFEDDQTQRRYPENDDRGGLDERGNEHFTHVKPQGGRHIQLQIAVMGSVKAPEEREGMIGPMKTVKEKIQENHGRDDIEGVTEAEVIKQTP
jgi:hypothetical protein